MIQTREELEALFASNYVPENFNECMAQKKFVDRLIIAVASMIEKYYIPPPEQHFILDGPREIRLIFKNGTVTPITNPLLMCRCLESDLSVIFWCNVFSHLNIVVITTDGDVLLALLLYTKYRINKVRRSSQGLSNQYDYGFLNEIYVRQGKNIIPLHYNNIVQLYHKFIQYIFSLSLF